MPLNSIPPTVTRSALEAKRRAARGKLSVDVAFWGGLIPGTFDELAGLVADGVSGFKSFLVDSGVPEFPAIGVDELTEGLRRMADLGVPSLLHAEDPAALLPVEGDTTEYQSYLASRPADAEARAVELAAAMAAETDAAVHVLHVSSGEAVAVLAKGPSNLTGETCPHYLFFCAEEIPDGSTPFKCAPPIRSAEHRDALWDALVDGDLAMVVSDHSPAPASIKAVDSGDFAQAWGGVGSLQLRLQATWTAARDRGIDIGRLGSWLALEPALLAGLGDRKGSIEVGKDADFVVFDPDGALLVTGEDLEHRHPITPYEGIRLRGSIVETILRGQTVYSEGRIEGGLGRMMRRR
jgi:allantoinase